MIVDDTTSCTSADADHRWVLALVGPPGSGKGTQATWLTSAMGLTALSTGELARLAARESSERGRVVKRYMSSGGLVPDSIVFEFLCEAIAELPASSRGLLFDGFPRTNAQVVALEETLLGRPVDVFVELRCDEEVVLERLAGRGRDDDKTLAVLRRLDEFGRWTRPMIEGLRAEGRVVTVDGAQPPAVVHRAITDALGQHRRQSARSLLAL